MKVKSGNCGCNANEFEKYELKFSADEIEILKQCGAEYTKAETDVREARKTQDKIVNKARYKRYQELFEEYRRKAVYSKSDNMYGRIMGLHMDHYGRITSFCVSGFNVEFKVTDGHGPYFYSDRPLRTMNINVNDVEFISDDIYQHEAEKFVEKIKQDVSDALMNMDSWLPEAWSSFDRQLESNYITMRDIDDDLLCGGVECCEDVEYCGNEKAARY